MQDSNFEAGYVYLGEVDGVQMFGLSDSQYRTQEYLLVQRDDQSGEFHVSTHLEEISGYYKSIVINFLPHSAKFILDTKATIIVSLKGELIEEAKLAASKFFGRF
jgi:hypothetical protein